VGGLGAVLIPLIMRYLPAMRGHIHAGVAPRPPLEVIQDVISHKKQYQALIFSGLILFGHFIIIPFINPFMEFNIGFSKDITPLIYLVGGISAFFASNILGRLADRFGKLTIFLICTLSAIPMVLTITNLPPTQLYVPVLTLFGCWFAVATGRGVTAGAMVSNVVNPEHRGSFQSFNSSIQQLGTGLASIAVGLIVGKDPVSGHILHYNLAGVLSVAVLGYCAWLGWRIFRVK
jgi:MFS transporter, DHA1 family, inner membrane transport protein